MPSSGQPMSSAFSLTASRPAISACVTVCTVIWLAGCDRSDAEHEFVHAPVFSQEAGDGPVVSAPDPWAVQVGTSILEQGGNAMDAAVAMQTTLGFVEAPETGLGGGGFLLYYHAESGTTRFYDGRETAPTATNPWQYSVLGQPLPKWLVVPQGQSVGVPGMVALMAESHAAHGQLTWSEVLAPTIELAQAGVPMPPRLQEQIAADPSLRLFGDTRRHFVHQASRADPRLRNPALADTLMHLAEQGPDWFYQGEMAAAIQQRAQARLPGASLLQPEDFAQYRAIEREPVCAPYRDWTVCGPPPPSSGGLTLLQILGLLAHFDLPTMTPDDPDALHLIAEASRLAFADRHHYVGDPDSVPVPVDELLASDYLAERAERISPQGTALTRVPPGRPADNIWLQDAEQQTQSAVTTGTSHFSVRDGDGNLVAMTGSNEVPFGSRMMVGGFLLNNQLTDFTFQPDYAFSPYGDGRHPNAPGPGKRPRSSMTPVIVFDQNDEPVLVLGSRGGQRIIGYVAQTLIHVLDWEQPLDVAIAAPRMVHTGHALELEADTQLAAQASDLSARGHNVTVRPLTSGLHGLQRTADGWVGAADPRLGGTSGHRPGLTAPPIE